MKIQCIIKFGAAQSLWINAQMYYFYIISVGEKYNYSFDSNVTLLLWEVVATSNIKFKTADTT